MKTTSFTPFGDLIIVEATVWGPMGHRVLELALDTGSAHTVILPEIMDELGFNPSDGLAITGVYSAVGKEQGYLIKVPRFEASASPAPTSPSTSSISPIATGSMASSA